MNPDKKTLIMNVIFLSQFSYCPARWIFPNKELSHKIKRLHERCPRVLRDESSPSIHYRNIQAFAPQMFRVYKEISQKNLTEIFPLIQPLNYNIII